MPHPREPLPPALKGEAFTVAQGRSIGLGRTRMRGSDLERPFRGVRIARESDPPVLPNTEQELPKRCAALLLTLPDGAFFSHVTAARLWPLPLPRATRPEPIHVSVRVPARPPRRDRVAGHLVKDSLVASALRRGLPLVDPGSLFCQLATALSLHDLVAVGDALAWTVVRIVGRAFWADRGACLARVRGALLEAGWRA